KMVIQALNRNRSSNLLLLAVLCSVVLVGLVGADEEEISMTLDEMVEMIEPFGEGCDPKPQRENIIEMVLNKEEAKRETKCFRQCMMEQFELMPEGTTQFSESKVIEMMNMMFPDKEEEGRRMLKTCNDRFQGPQDKCEAAHGISLCMLKEMRTAGFKIPDIKE
ncbi:hypothetical protein KR018_000694, partial [Drosophila ironensis]